MDTVLLREQLSKEIERLPDDIIWQVADFTHFIMARHKVTPLYAEWEDQEWQDFSLAQLFREEDDVEYTLEDAQEVYLS